MSRSVRAAGFICISRKMRKRVYISRFKKGQINTTGMFCRRINLAPWWMLRLSHIEPWVESNAKEQSSRHDFAPFSTAKTVMRVTRKTRRLVPEENITMIGCVALSWNISAFVGYRRSRLEGDPVETGELAPPTPPRCHNPKYTQDTQFGTV